MKKNIESFSEVLRRLQNYVSGKNYGTVVDFLNDEDTNSTFEPDIIRWIHEYVDLAK